MITYFLFNKRKAKYKMKKILSIALIVILALSLVSCSRSDAPEGMQSATAPGEPFILYVPKTYTVNTSSGISSAYMTFDANYTSSVIVTARYYTPDADMSVDEYVAFLGESYTAAGTDIELISSSSTVLGGLDAKKLDYKLTESGKTYSLSQYITKHKGDLISLSFYVSAESPEMFTDGIDQILTYFTLTDKSDYVGDNKVDKHTPDGMKIASSDNLEYRFYVPSAWICESESGVSEAYYPESGKTNVTVTSYSPTSPMTLEEYCELSQKNYADTLAGYALTKVTKDLKVSDCDAAEIEFEAKYGETEYVIRQVVVYYPQVNLFYNITYTATAENAPLHTADFEAMIAAFTFR